ncbi:MAG: hypothetical protein JWN57_1830, partial [Frankiales bacterium]|nr:hypothetical protein [Frankiales bacterium]
MYHAPRIDDLGSLSELTQEGPDGMVDKKGTSTDQFSGQVSPIGTVGQGSLVL